jgi:hypothetical protein
MDPIQRGRHSLIDTQVVDLVGNADGPAAQGTAVTPASAGCRRKLGNVSDARHLEDQDRTGRDHRRTLRRGRGFLLIARSVDLEHSRTSAPHVGLGARWAYGMLGPVELRKGFR